MPLLADPAAFRETIDRLAAWAGPRAPDLILGAEARGFIFGGALAYALGCGFVTARKPGKLPWETIEARYDLEYGTDALEVHIDAISPGARVIVLDDVLATGGTARREDRARGAARRRRRRRAVRDRALLPARPRPDRRHGRARADRLQLSLQTCVYSRRRLTPVGGAVRRCVHKRSTGWCRPTGGYIRGSISTSTLEVGITPTREDDR